MNIIYLFQFLSSVDWTTKFSQKLQYKPLLYVITKFIVSLKFKYIPTKIIAAKLMILLNKMEKKVRVAEVLLKQW